jgi:osmotically-inducible protein OsmY
MPESRTKEVKTKLIDQEDRANYPGRVVSETDCLDIRQAPTVWRVSEDEKISDQNLHTFFALPLQAGQKVYCPDGYAGKIIALRIDPQGHIKNLVVQLGRFFRRRLVVPFEWVDRIEAESVYLSVEKGDLKILPEKRPDTTLVVEVERALWEDVFLRRTEANRIHVSAKNGVIGLEGYVSSSAQKTRAEEAARRVPGVLAVQNCLVTDDDLNIAATRATAKIPLSYRERIFVGAHNGFIILNGEVSTIEARWEAEELAGKVPHIRGVLNSIRVTDARIEMPEQPEEAERVA